MLVCHACGLLNAVQHKGHNERCRRSGAVVHLRKPDSINRSSALLIAAVILYIPANFLPIMKTSTLFGSELDTILSGIIYLWSSGSWPIALVIFIASILVPSSKMIALTVLLVSVQRRSTWRPMERARLYRMIELVGRWSMVDVFVVALMVQLVQLKSLATISAGPGVVAFGAVVVLTIFAAEAFDPRLIWDPLGDDNNNG
ncbi:paraquat-inducible protein A [Propionivibrio sp.]|uniref:paraquat-inducible protein A n=1 Tax=Propionivibrio sp. TaxID=2212460 RepID=UPI003BF11F64